MIVVEGVRLIGLGRSDLPPVFGPAATAALLLGRRFALLRSGPTSSLRLRLGPGLDIVVPISIVVIEGVRRPTARLCPLLILSLTPLLGRRRRGDGQYLRRHHHVAIIVVRGRLRSLRYRRPRPRAGLWWCATVGMVRLGGGGAAIGGGA